MNDAVKLLSRPVNFAVVQLPGRQHPGVVVQGDTLNGLVNQLSRIRTALDKREIDELKIEIQNITNVLSEALDFYNSVCRGS